MYKGHLSITRIKDNCKERMIIKLKDIESTIPVLEISTSLEDLLRALTGVASQDCEYYISPLEVLQYLGCTKEIRLETMPKPNTYRPEEIRNLVVQDFSSKYPNTEWRILDDGLTNQQNKNFYEYKVYRYIKSF